MGEILRRGTLNSSYIYMGEILRRVCKTPPIYMRFCVGVHKTSPIYRGVRLSIGVRNFSTATPIYIYSYIYGSENLTSVMLSIALKGMFQRSPQHFLTM